MFWKSKHCELSRTKAGDRQKLTLDELKKALSGMYDADIVEHQTDNGQKVVIAYVRTLIDKERLNECIIAPLLRDFNDSLDTCIRQAKISTLDTLEESLKNMFEGSILVCDVQNHQWVAISLQNPLSRGIETSQTESILYGPKDSFSEQIDDNITLIRRRLPLAEVKTEKFTLGSLSQTTIIMLYIDKLTNPEFISIAKNKIKNIDFDLFLDSSQVATFMEDNYHSVFPQYQHTDRPDVCAYSLGLGKITFLVNNSSFAFIGPITLFDLFQSPEDYINRWLVASFLRCIRYLSFLLSLILIPSYVALTAFHYQMIPLQILFVLLESRSKLPFTPYWEALLMLLTLEVIKEASIRMPTKSGQTLGVIGGIVVGEAAVSAGFVSQVLIVLVGISAIASFLTPNYLVTKATAFIQFLLLVLSSLLGFFGIFLGLILLLIHLNGLSSLKQPYLAPVAPFYGRDWIDLFIRGPLHWMRKRPAYLHPLQKRRRD
ncbi:spore germination protein [Paenibacillus humicola]|uniref:spore germination protein n=1 Tax=Paenibacillus humicola TaxID=3110540 RepID=UPI00237A3C08|nr:spore germination protein [Paenibacillus humicola]